MSLIIAGLPLHFAENTNIEIMRPEELKALDGQQPTTQRRRGVHLSANALLLFRFLSFSLLPFSPSTAVFLSSVATCFRYIDFQ